MHVITINKTKLLEVKHPKYFPDTYREYKIVTCIKLMMIFMTLKYE